MGTLQRRSILQCRSHLQFFISYNEYSSNTYYWPPNWVQPKHLGRQTLKILRRRKTFPLANDLLLPRQLPKLPIHRRLVLLLRPRIRKQNQRVTVRHEMTPQLIPPLHPEPAIRTLVHAHEMRLLMLGQIRRVRKTLLANRAFVRFLPRVNDDVRFQFRGSRKDLVAGAVRAFVGPHAGVDALVLLHGVFGLHAGAAGGAFEGFPEGVRLHVALQFRAGFEASAHVSVAAEPVAVEALVCFGAVSW